jgi:metallo-beta-lactamase family protein
MQMKISSFGAAHTVTGSNHLLEMDGKQILLDCGLFQGSRALDDLNDLPWGYDIHGIEALFLSHAHLDHSGRLPKLVKDGFKRQIIATQATREIVEQLLNDSAKLQREDYERNKRKGREASPPMYDEDDVVATLELFNVIEYGKPLDWDNISVTAQVAGHIPGSASLLFECAGERFVFSGDLGNARKDILPDPVPCPDADIVLMESTYGDRDHRPFEESLKELASLLIQASERGGKILIPSFALERTQDLLYHIARLEEQKLIPILPVFVDSPLAGRIEKTYSTAKHEFVPEIQKMFESQDPFETARLEYTKTTDESKALNTMTGSAVIIAGSGMMTGGRILHHLMNHLGDPKTSLVIVGFQPEGGLGRRLVDGADRVRINGEDVVVRASINTINGFSAHADRTELLEWSKDVKGEVRLVHGEMKSMESLTEALKARGQKASIQAPSIAMPGEGGHASDGE